MTDRCHLRVASYGDGEVLQAMLSAQMRVLAQWNPHVDLEQKVDAQWFERPHELWPYLVLSGASQDVAGFALVCGRRYAEAMGVPGADFYLHEFYIAERHRRRGIGRAAVEALFARHPGTWVVHVLPANRRARAFWAACFGDGAERSEVIAGDGVSFERYCLAVDAKS